ncbi:MAG: transglutaminase family protein, partial [Planctomycetota bacterium]
GGGGAPPHGRTGEFDVRHELEVNVPEGAQRLRIWFTLPQDLPAQEAADLEIRAPHETRTVTDSRGNKLLYLEVRDPREPQLRLLTTFHLKRHEVNADLDASRTRPLTDAELESMEEYLRPSRYVLVDDEIRELTARVVGGERNPIRASRKIYDWVLRNVDYWVKHPDRLKPSGVGSTSYCLSAGTGNCTDFHSLYMSLSRAAKIPVRMSYGSFLKKTLDGLDTDQSYHCWAEFYAPNLGWIPIDVAVADLFVGDFELSDANRRQVILTTAAGYTGGDPRMVDYYFGNLDERRITWTVGRDLILEPRQSDGLLNALPKAYVEVDGRVLAEQTGWTRKLTYRQLN